MTEAFPPAAIPLNVNGRYEIQDPPIGQGGMGVVYKAYDSITRRHVALKTMPGGVDGAAIEMFEREWTVLARISHPNIIDILDTGEFHQDGQRRPYFVMPLLKGCTLDQLIKHSSERLTVERVIDIVGQTCRGLQAAHDQGLVHRDMKPSNIFVMEDDTIKIIDFGIAHLADTRSVTGIKGTLQYMAPEQLEMKPPTPLSDLFSLAVVTYEALTGRRPFARKTDSEVVDAIRTYVPPPATEVNNAVNQMISRTVHKAMAKQSWHRFSNAREFGDTLKRAVRNEPIERFDKGKIQPRIDRIKKAQSEGDFQFAGEILTELESEGHIDPDMSMLRAQIDQTIRQRTIRQLLESARTRIEEDELPLALQKIQSVLEVDPVNADALALKGQVERQRSERQVENWFRVVRQHIENQDYNQARQGLGEILKINSADTRARELLSTVDQTEAELLKAQEEKQKLYDAAMDSYRRGEISTALGKLERLLEIHRTAPRSSNPERDAQYQSLYNQVRSEHDAVRNAYLEARRHLLEKNFARVLEICNETLSKHPDDTLLQALKLEAGELERQQQSALVAEVNQRVEKEPDLDKKFSILTDAIEKCPEEEQFKLSLKMVRERRDLMNSIVARARQYESNKQLNEAAGQWDILKNIYPLYPGLDFELQRIALEREKQARSDTKALWVQQVDRHLDQGQYEKAQEVLKQASAEFPDDGELAGLSSIVDANLKRSAEAAALMQTGRTLLNDHNYAEGLEAFRRAERLDDRNPAVRAALMGAIVKRARELMLENWREAEPLVHEATELDGTDPVVRSLSTLIEDYKRQEAVGRFVVEARTLQASGDLPSALQKVQAGLQTYPNEIRLSQLYNTLRSASIDNRRSAASLASTAAGIAAKIPALTASGVPATDPAVPSSNSPNGSDASTPTPSQVTVESVLPSLKEGGKGEVAQPPIVKVLVAPEPSLGSNLSAPPASVPAVNGGSFTVAKGKQPNRSGLLWAAAAAGIILVATALLLRSPSKLASGAKGVVPPALSASVPILFTANVPGVHYSLDGSAVASTGITVAPGSAHKAEAMLEGYATDFREFTAPANTTQKLALAFNLEPLLPELRVNSDLKAGHYILDSAAPADLQDGSLVRDSIPSGDHTLTILDGNRPTFAFSFSAKPVTAAQLSAPLAAKLSPGVVVTSLGASARVYGTPGLKGALDGQAPVPIPPEGVVVSLNDHQAARFIVEESQGKQHPVSIDFSPLPVLSVFLSGAAERIPLVINANVPDGSVSLNGQLLKRTMVDGARTVLLPPGTYHIKVSRSGYEEVPEQIIVLKSGDSNIKPLQFALAEIPRRSTLAVEGAPQNAEISIDGVKVGSVNSAGAFTKEVSPGAHAVTIHKANYEDIKQSSDFRVNQTLRISAFAMKGPGVVNFKVLPQNAVIHYVRDGDTNPSEAQNNHSIDLRSGIYELTVEADNCLPKKDLLVVNAGKSYEVAWTLKPKAVDPLPVVKRTVSDVFENASAWTANEKLWVHDGKGISFTRRREGEFVFDLINPKDSKGIAGSRMRRIVFVADYAGPDNQILYTLDSKNLSRKVFAGSKAENESKTESGMSDHILRINVEITGSTITVRNRAGKILDSIRRNGSNGRFGFVDEVALLPVN